jgi:F420-non-reducing hydrogenase iron-sulfur subunit
MSKVLPLQFSASLRETGFVVNVTKQGSSMHPDKPKSAFEPKIIAFVCTWCTYAGADLAGTSRMQYPPNVRVLKFPCTGRIDPVFILKAFQQGADGVLVSGCHPGDCHYIAGNFHARRRFAAFRKLLEFVGVDLNRLQFSWVSAAEGGKWVEVVTDLTEKVCAMGPMTEFTELALEEQWSGAIDSPELKEAYNAI